MSVDPHAPHKTRVSVTFTSPFMERMDRMIEEGIVLDRQELIRAAVREYLEKHGLTITLEEAET